MDYPTTLYGLLDEVAVGVLIGWVAWLWLRPARTRPPAPPKASEKPAEPTDPNGES